MKLSRTHYYAAGLLVLLMVLPSSAQKTGSSGSQASKPQPGGAGSSGQPTGTSQPSNPRMQTPLYIKGRVIMNTGEPVPEPVSVGLNCGMRLLQAIHTDAKGYFEFVLGAGPQGNVDMSASNDTMGRAGGNTNFSGGFGGMGGFGGDPGNRVMGCELQVSVAGYEPLTKTITDPGDVTGIEAGTLQLRRLAGVEGSSISVTSLQVPSSARKEFDKATSDLRSNHVASATQHLEKAVSIYDKYAAAWNQLGTDLYLQSPDGRGEQSLCQSHRQRPEIHSPLHGSSGPATPRLSSIMTPSRRPERPWRLTLVSGSRASSRLRQAFG